MANSNNWGEIYKSTWWGDKAWSANTLFIDSAPPGFGLNLLKGSEDLDNTIDWKRLPDTTDVPTVSANTITDPNGGTTAERVDFSANSTARLQQRVTLEASKQYTFSVYAKVNTGTQSFRLRNVTLRDAEAKTATTSWTRFSYTFTTTTAGDYDLSLQNSGNTARTLEFWGAMLNEGATAGDYVKTEASVSGSAPAPAYSGFGDAFGGVTAYYSLRKFTEAETLNAIRVRRSSDDTEQDIGFDANGDLDTTALLEFVGGQNLLLQSEDFTTSWSLDNVISTANVTTDPNGTENADLLDDGTASSTQHWIYQSSSFSNSTTYTLSFYAKYLSRQYMAVNIYNGSTSQYVYFDIQNGSIYGSTGDVTASITSVGNGWYRVVYTRTMAATGSPNFRIAMADDSRNITYTGSNKQTYIWGAQLEEGSTASTYNKTTTGIGGDGAVTTFYDQSGNGNNATNATESEQPLVVSGGTLVEENGKAAIDFDGSVVGKKLTFTYAASTPISSFIVMKERGTNDFPYVLGASNGSLGDILCLGFIKSSSTVRNFISGINQFVDANYTDYSLYTSIMDAANSVLGRNGSSGAVTNNATGTSGLTTFVIGAQPNNLLIAAVDGTMQEIIIFDSNQSSNRGSVSLGTGIEGNINEYFDIV